MTYLPCNLEFIFAHGIKTNINAPLKLKVNLESEIWAESTTQDTSNPIPAVFKLRKGDKAKNLIPESRLEKLTFKEINFC